MTYPGGQEPGKKYYFYRILGAVDNFIAIFFLFIMLLNFAAMGLNTMLLLPLFVSISILLYTNFTAVFARHIMVKGNYLRYRIKEWIKVNAYVTIIYAILVVLLITWSLTEGSAIKTLSENMDIPAGIIHQMMFVILCCMVLLAVHVVMTFRYLKQFNDHFRQPDDPGNDMPAA